MGFDIINMSWDFGPEHEAKVMGANNKQLARKAQRAEIQLEEIARRFENLTMVTEAMWELLKENSQLSDDDLINRIKAVNKQISEDVRCGSCNKTLGRVARNRDQCLYCGTKVEPDGTAVFDKIKR